MVTKNTSVKLDGKTKFALDDTYTWKNGKLDYVEIHAGETKKDVTVTLNLSGSDWSVSHIEALGSDNLMTVISDKTAAAGAKIEALALHSGLGNKVTLTNTHVEFYDGSDGKDQLTIGAGGADMVNLEDGNNSLKIGSGKVHSVLAGDGNDTVKTGNSNIDVLDLGDGNNKVNLGKGSLGTLMLGAGDDTVTIGDGSVSQINLGDGHNIINITGAANIGSILGDTGDDVVNFTGTGNVEMINLAKGNNSVTTGTGTVSTLTAFLGNQTIDVGTGGISNIRLSDGNQTITADGHIGNLLAGLGNHNLTFNDAVGVVDIGDGVNTIKFGGQYVDGLAITGGTDTITLANDCNLNQAVTGTGDDILHAEKGSVGAVQFGQGDDILYTGDGVIGSASFGAGNDTVYFGDMTDPSQESEFNGGGGTDFVDTISFVKVTTGGVTISLATSDVQTTSSGELRFWNFEKLIGSNFADTLTGSNGADFIGGGKGNDVLRGGGGTDTFIFNTGDGQDEIKDFDVSSEKIDISSIKGVSHVSDLTITDDGHGNALIDFGGGDTITVDGVGAGRFTDSQFIF